MNNSMKTPLIRLAKREGMDKRTVWAIRVGSILLALLPRIGYLRGLMPERRLA